MTSENNDNAYEAVTASSRLTTPGSKPSLPSSSVRRTASERIPAFGRKLVWPIPPTENMQSEYDNTCNRINSSRRFQSEKPSTTTMTTKSADKDKNRKPSPRTLTKESTPGTCRLFPTTDNANLDATLRLFEERISKYTTNPTGGNPSREDIHFNQSFAGAIFDIKGGYLNLPEFKLTMYIPPKSVAAGSEPIYLYGDRQATQAPPLSDGEQLVSPIITCGKQGVESRMDQDIVLSFPLYTCCGGGGRLGTSGEDSLCDTLQPMRKDIGKDSQWNVLADEIDCLKVVTRGGRCTLMVDRLGCYAVIAATNPQFTAAADDSRRDCCRTSMVCVGVFSKTHAEVPDTINIVIVFWRDSAADKQVDLNKIK